MARPVINSDSLPKAGRVNEVCREWLVYEDGALAYRLQDKEIKEHYSGNKFRNAQVREDLPRAKVEQQLEEIRYYSRVQQQEEKDALIARQVALKMDKEDLFRDQKLEENTEYLSKIDHKNIQMKVELEMQRSLQEEKDQEIAKIIQEEEISGNFNVNLFDNQFLRDQKLAMEVQDAELARMLQEKERIKARRARERARQKKLNRQHVRDLKYHTDVVEPQILNELESTMSGEKELPQQFHDFTHQSFQCSNHSEIRVSNDLKEDIHKCSNVAIKIDPTYCNNSDKKSLTSSSNSLSSSRMFSTYTQDVSGTIPSYTPIQGQRRIQTPSLSLPHEEKNKRRVKDGCKNQ